MHKDNIIIETDVIKLLLKLVYYIFKSTSKFSSNHNITKYVSNIYDVPIYIIIRYIMYINVYMFNIYVCMLYMYL